MAKITIPLVMLGIGQSAQRPVIQVIIGKTAPFMHIPDTKRLQVEISMWLIGATRYSASEAPENLSHAHRGLRFGRTPARGTALRSVMTPPIGVSPCLAAPLKFR